MPARIGLLLFVIASIGLAGCGEDWRIEPCVGESDETCRVDTLTVDGRERSYVVSRRHGYDCSGGEVPLVLMWHGSGGNGASFRANMNDDFDALDFEATVGANALVVYPDGLPHWDCWRRTCWDRDPEGYDLAFFDALVPRLAEEFCVDTSRVFSLGHSRGGRFVEVLACHRSEAHRAVASIAAGVGNVEDCPGRVPIWLSHGQDDGTIAFSEGESHREHWAERNGCDPVIDPGGFVVDACAELRGCDEGLPVVWCPTTGADWDGHAPPALADEAIWAFFSRISR